MLSIESLKLHLPQGMENRAGHIANMVSESLSDQVFENSNDLSSLSIGEVIISAEETDWLIAQKIAAEIVSQIRSQL